MLIENIKEHSNYLARHSSIAAQVWEKPDWENIKPVLKICNNKDWLAIYTYYRIVASGYKQKMQDVGMCRSTRCVIIDENSGGILGLILYADVYDKWNIRDNYIGWTDERRHDNINKIIHIQRCIVIPPYGKMLIGKLLYSMAISWEMVRYLGLKYSHKICLFTTHGVGKKRNTLVERLPYWRFLGIHDKGKRSASVYACETRKHAIKFMREEYDENKLRRKVPYMAEIVEYWKERWLVKRLNQTIVFKEDMYKFSKLKKING